VGHHVRPDPTPLPIIGPPGAAAEERWRALAAAELEGPVELGDDLHRFEISPRR
jgi:hypothetical protein